MQKSQQIRMSQKLRNEYERAYIQGKQNSLGLYKKLVSDYEQGEPLLTLGPNYIFFTTAFLAANLISFLIIFSLSNQQRFKPFYFVSIVILVFLDVVWLATALVNPGIAPKSDISQGQVCEECLAEAREISKEDRRYHCKECHICVDQQIMHFWLVGACIGKHNFITFKLLLLGIFLWTLSLIMVIPQTLHKL